MVNMSGLTCSKDLQITYDEKRLNELFRYFQAISRAVHPKPLDIESEQAYTQLIPRLSGDPTLNALAQLGVLRLDCERAFVSLIDDQQQHIVAETTKSLSLFDANIHLPGDQLCMGEVPLTLTAGVCAGTSPILTSQTGQTIHTDNIFADQSRYVINDFREEALYKDRPYIVDHPHMRYYAEVPLKTESGFVIGSYSVVDNKPRLGLDDDSYRILSEIAKAIMRHLDLIKTNDNHVRSMRLLEGLHNFVHANDTFSRMTVSENNMRADGQGGGKGINSQNVERLNATVIPLKRPCLTSTDPVIGPDTLSISSEIVVNADPPLQNNSRSPSDRNPGPEAGPTEIMESELPTEGPPTKRMKKEAKTPAYRTTGGGGRLAGAIIKRATLMLQSAMDVDGVSLLDVSARFVQNQGRSGSVFSHPYLQRYFPEPKDISVAYKTAPTSDHVSYALQNIQNTMIQRFPNGQIFNIAGDGHLAGSASLGTATGRSMTLEWPKAPPVGHNGDNSDMEIAIKRALPAAKSCIFIPIWNSRNKEQGAPPVMTMVHIWDLSCTDNDLALTIFAWTSDRTRVFAPEEFSYCRAFGDMVVAELARLELETTNHAKSDFISSISHELRSPLHGILASTEFLHEMPLSREQVQMVDMIHNCGRTLLDTVEHILDYSKINNLRQTGTSGKSPTNTESPHGSSSSAEADFDMGIMVEETINSLVFAHCNNVDASVRQRSPDGPLSSPQNGHQSLSGSSTAIRDLAITLEVSAQQNWTVASDISAWRRILSNLLGNSLKYTSSGLIHVSLAIDDGVSETDAGKPKVVTLTVSDTGRGMSESYLQNHLFTPFAQENSLSNGVGLGLSIVRTLVDSLGGSICVESTSGKGTTATVSAPVKLSQSLTSSTETLLEKFTGRLVYIYDSNPDPKDSSDIGPITHATAHRTAIIDAFKAQAQNWLDVGAVDIHHVASTTTGVVAVYEDELASLTTQLTSKGLFGNTTPSIVLLVLCTLNSRCDSSSVPEAIPTVILTQPIGPQKLSRSLTACFDAIANSGTAQRPTPIQSSSLTTRVATKSPVFTDNARYQSKPNAPAPSEAHGQNDLNLKTPSSKPAPNFLLVDDNTINLKLLVAFAKKLGGTYTTAENGCEAVDAYIKSQQRFDFVLMDLSMPIMDGFEATAAIRAHERKRHLSCLTPPTTIVALTGLGSKEAQQRANEVGIDVFLIKPIQLKQLRGRLDSR